MLGYKLVRKLAQLETQGKRACSHAREVPHAATSPGTLRGTAPHPGEDVRVSGVLIGVHGAVKSNAQNRTGRNISLIFDSEVFREHMDDLLAYIRRQNLKRNEMLAGFDTLYSGGTVGVEPVTSGSSVSRSIHLGQLCIHQGAINRVIYILTFTRCMFTTF